jgi:hypothetical protein
MNKALIAFAIISSLMLLAVGCKTEPASPTPTAEEEQQGVTGTETAQPETSEIPASKTPAAGITGSINEVDSLDSELNDPELEKTGEYLEEIDW